MNFSALAEEYKRSHRFGKLSDKTRYSYEYALRCIEEGFGKTDIAAIRRPDIIRFQTKNEERPGAANLCLRVMSLVLQFALDMDYIPFNPARGLKKLKGGSLEKWTPDEVRRLIELRDRKISTAVVLAWYTGQRESDILNMKWKDYDGEYISLMQDKTDLEMKIKVHADLKGYLDAIRGDAADNDFIVSGKTKFNGPAFRGMFARRLALLGIDKTFHGIRKGVACSLAEGGSSINRIAAILGHKTLRMAAYYAEQADSQKMAENAVGELVSCV
jgi:integrase